MNAKSRTVDKQTGQLQIKVPGTQPVRLSNVKTLQVD